MRKFTLMFMGLWMTVFGLQGQSLTYNVKSVVMSGSATDPNAFVKDILITNGFTSDSVFEWTKVDQTGPSQWNFVFCDPVGCYDPVPANAEFTLSPGSKGKIKLDILSNNVSGSGKLSIAVFPKGNPSKADTVTFTISVWNLKAESARQQPELNLFPNPVKDELTLSFQGKSNLQVELVSLIGSRVKLYQQVADQAKLDLSGVPDGIYIVRIHDGPKVYTRRITKN